MPLPFMKHRALFCCSVLAAAGAHCGGGPGETSGRSNAQAVTAAGAVSPSASSGFCLDVVGQSTANGAAVQVWSCTGNSNQQWTYDGTSLRVYGDKCLDVTGGNTADGTKLQIWDCVAGDANQAWTRSGNTFQWTNHGTCLDLTGGTAQDGTLVQSWTCVAGDANQEWTVNGGSGSGSSSGGSSSGGSSGSSSGGAAGGADGGASTTAKQTVLAFLTSISGKRTAIGVEDKAGGEADSDQMSSMAGNGQSPSFWSGDFGFGSAAEPSSRQAIVQEGEKQWGQGTIVQYIYHACPLSWGSNEEGCAYSGGTDPIDGSCGDLSDAQWADLTTSGGTLNGVWLARLDTIATYFQQLKDAGIAPLFRPLHEINGSSQNGGCWAWWQGRPGPTGSARLYQITHDYLVNTKGLDNIIWVWNTQDYTTLASDVSSYTPGASYFDIAALDVYNTGYTSGNYNAMVGAAAGKPIGVAECAVLPYPSTLASQPLWAYVAVWPDYLYSPYQSYNSAQIPQLFADSQVIPLAQMPGWQ